MIINPHAMPSRMTMGLSLETIASKVGAITGETINATAFVKQDEDAFYRVLMQYGYHSNGSEEMYSGITGRKLGSGMMFVGPVFVQSLRHHVSDKYQSAYNPPIDPTTRQPVRGRNRGGAIRVGEMERDAFLGHAGTKLVQESLCLRSDATEVVFCKRCGTIAIEDRVSQETKCRKCKGEGEFARAVIPYIYLHMVRLLRAAGISMTVGTGSETEGRRVNDMELLKSAAELKAEERAYEENKDADAEEEEIQEEDDFGLEDMDEYGGDEDGELYMD
jgi:DNA-directed RNA polymerase I subunit RPA2